MLQKSDSLINLGLFYDAVSGDSALVLDLCDRLRKLFDAFPDASAGLGRATLQAKFFLVFCGELIKTELLCYFFCRHGTLYVLFISHDEDGRIFKVTILQNPEQVGL